MLLLLKDRLILDSSQAVTELMHLSHTHRNFATHKLIDKTMRI